MHRYRDAIVSKLSNKIQFKYDTFGAYVMFPYGDEEKFKAHNLYKSIEEGGVRYYGKIKSCKEYNREECVEIKSRPGTEKKKYLRIELEEIKETTKIEPIQYGTRLISYTTMYLLEKAENTHELKLGSSLELEVYKIMKKISKAKEVEIKKISSKGKNDEEEIIKEYSIGDINIKIDGAIIKVEDKEIAFGKFENELYNINKA